MSTLIIKGVNTILLDKQRYHLLNIAEKIRKDIKNFSDEEMNALNGIINMLDDWSDIAYFKAGE